MLANYEDEFCKVSLVAIENEWNYSNPTGMFNLSLIEKLRRMKSYDFVAYHHYMQNEAHQKLKAEFREKNPNATEEDI